MPPVRVLGRVAVVLMVVYALVQVLVAVTR